MDRLLAMESYRFTLSRRDSHERQARARSGWYRRNWLQAKAHASSMISGDVFTLCRPSDVRCGLNATNSSASSPWSGRRSAAVDAAREAVLREASSTVKPSSEPPRAMRRQLARAPRRRADRARASMRRISSDGNARLRRRDPGSPTTQRSPQQRLVSHAPSVSSSSTRCPDTSGPPAGRPPRAVGWSFIRLTLLSSSSRSQCSRASSRNRRYLPSCTCGMRPARAWAHTQSLVTPSRSATSSTVSSRVIEPIRSTRRTRCLGPEAIE